MSGATRLLYEAVHHTPHPAGESLCYVCGLEGDSRPLKLPPAFMSHADCDGRGSSLCSGCEHYFAPGSNYRRAGHRLLTAAEFRPLAREELDDLLFALPWPQERYVLTLQIAKHKNIIPWAVVNDAGMAPVIASEEWGEIVLDRSRLAPVRASFRRLYEAGHGKESILADAYPYLTAWVKKGGNVSDWMRDRSMLRTWIGSAELNLISYVTLKEATDDE